MNPVRPPVWPQATSNPVNRPAPQAGGVQGGGQRAFFDAAMGRAGAAPAPPTPPVAPVEARPQTQTPFSAARYVAPPVQPADEAPKKILRPGSFLDIRV